MLLLQTNVLGSNKWNCFKAMQVLGGPAQILIWGSEIAKGPTRQNFKGGEHEHQWCIYILYILYI